MDNAHKTKYCLLAVDAGPRSALAPLAAQNRYHFINYDENAASSVHYWEMLLDGYAALILGTSDSDNGRTIEDAGHRAAENLGMTIIVIEDYPGNYRPVQNRRTDLLVVDCMFAANLYKNNYEEKPPSIWISPAARFDNLRRESKKSRHTYQEMIGMSEDKGSVMWIGQPETEDAIETLERLLDDFTSLGVELLFKAHPRDKGYKTGSYNHIFHDSTLSVTDVTYDDLYACHKRSPLLAVTQFSSMAIELGFLGIPSVHVLYQDVGGRRLKEKKGFMIPPWCDYGASFLVTNKESQKEIMNRALNDIDERMRIMSKFDSYFETTNYTLPGLVARIEQEVCGYIVHH